MNKIQKKFTKLKKNRQNSEVVEINDFPQANLRKKIPACKKSTKFLHWNKISFLRSYNTYTCKQENTNFVRFQVTLCEFCWNFVAQQNSNKILFLLEFYGVRGSTVLFRRLYFCERKSIDPNFPLSTKFCKILLFLRAVFFVFWHITVNKILWNFVVFAFNFLRVFAWPGQQNFVEFCCFCVQFSSCLCTFRSTTKSRHPGDGCVQNWRTAGGASVFASGVRRFLHH